MCKLCKWTQKLRDKIDSNKTKTVGAKNDFKHKHHAWNIAYCLWILYDLGSAIWLGDTLQSLNRVLAERRRVDSYKSCNWLTIETVETSKRLEWKAMHFVAFRKLKSDTSATISELPFSFLSLWVEYYNNIDIKSVCSSFKIGDMFGVKDPRGLRTCVVYKFLWASSNACYVGETLDIYPHVYVSTWSVIGPLTFSDIYIILHNVALFVLMSVLTP